MYADLHLKLKEDNSSDLNKYLREFKPSLMLSMVITLDLIRLLVINNIISLIDISLPLGYVLPSYLKTHDCHRLYPQNTRL